MDRLTPRNCRTSVKSWFKFVRVSGVFLMGDIWSWLRRFAAERRRVREPERSREAAQLRRLRRPPFYRLSSPTSTASRR